jgi:hypothetical protein
VAWKININHCNRYTGYTTLAERERKANMQTMHNCAYDDTKNALIALTVCEISTKKEKRPSPKTYQKFSLIIVDNPWRTPRVAEP